MCDYAMRTAKALMKGDWKKCSNLLFGLDVWKLVPGDDFMKKICGQDPAHFSSQYDYFSLKQLCGM
eukprot:6499099-Ditylum_brightwellii.AAC.1